MKFAVRLFFVLFLFLISLFVFRSGSFAQSTTGVFPSSQTQSNISTDTNPNVPKNLHNWAQTALIETVAAVSCQITGIDPINSKQKCLGVDQKTGQIGFVENGGGVIGALSSNISIFYNIPVHTGDYLSYVSKNFGLAKPSYAASDPGIGFSGLQPIIGVWTAFRNIAYLFFVLIFLIIGIAIMLRVKIDPRTVMTIQNQIPKIIIGVVLVTFSFAIAGFLIDVMWTMMYVLFGVLSTVSAGIPGSTLQGLDPVSMLGNTPLGIVGGVGGLANPGIFSVPGIPAAIAPHLGNLLKNTLGIATCPKGLLDVACFNNLFNPINFIPNIANPNPINVLIDLVSDFVGAKAFLAIGNFIAPTGEGWEFLGISAGSAPGVAIGIAAGAVAGGAAHALTELLLREFAPQLIVYLIIYITLLITLLRLWFELIKAYIFIILDVIFAPFWIIAGLIPGNSGVNFSSWIRDLAANLAVFPAVAAMFWIGKILVDAFVNSSGQMFVPPLVGNPTNPTFIGAIIGLGIILATPQVAVMIKKAVKAPSMGLGGVGQALGAGIGVPKRVVSGGISTVIDPFRSKDAKGVAPWLSSFARGFKLGQ